MPRELDITEFRKLKPHSQEDFLADGGTISTTIVPLESVISLQQEGGSGSSKELESGSSGSSTIETFPTPQPSLFQQHGHADNNDPSGARESTIGEADTIEMNPISSTVESAEPSPIPKETPPSQDYTPAIDSLSAEDRGVIAQYTDGFNIKTPVHLLMILDDDIITGAATLHPWQIEFMVDFAKEHTKDTPFSAAVRAANGSGKDKYIVAACVVWLCMRYTFATGVVTNGSGAQLDNQTERYIRHLCNQANLKWAGGKELIWKCNYRYYECIPTKSPITLFATDEPNKAEGYHPLKAGGKMGIFASEAKAIPDAIFGALTRCKGFTHRVDVSSPGLPTGYFYNKCNSSIKRPDFTDIMTRVPGTVIQYHVTAFDCPHISAFEIKDFANDCLSGENDPLYISGILAEFTTTDEMVVIPYAFVQWGYEIAPKRLGWIQETFNKGGLDLSDGGAETCLVVRNGNRHLKTIPFKFQDTQDTIHFLEDRFGENGLTNKEALVFSDCCGIGKPMLDQLKSRGWSNMRYVDSRHKSSDKKVYFNRGTELFFNIRLLLERKELIVDYDKLLVSQLSGRYYKLREGTVRQLLTKLEQKSRGYPSPDRADAFNLAFWDYKTTRVFKDYHENAPSIPESMVEVPKVQGDFSLKVWAGGNTSNLETFRANVSKHKPVTYLQRELDRLYRKN